MSERDDGAFAKPRLKVGGCRQPVTHYSIVENGVEV